MNADFTSALFLGLRHPSAAGAGRLTEGKPAALQEPAGASAAAAAVASAQGAAAAVVARTSLHALVDVLTTAAPAGALVVVDEHSYPISFWAAAVAAQGGAAMTTFGHHDADHVRRLLHGRRRRGAAVVLTDGWCGGCSRPAPLRSLAAVAAEAGATLVVDDSLAAGVLGADPEPWRPLGSGGQGTPAWSGLPPDQLVSVASTAKAFGAPLAVVTGPATAVAMVRRGPSRLHASPPTRADVAALTEALADPTLPQRRRRLARLIGRVRDFAGEQGLAAAGLPFPAVQLPMPLARADDLRRRMLVDGVSTLVIRSGCAGTAALGVLVRADHSDVAVNLLLQALGRQLHRGAA
ncbi:8-amino-7-oxononanoate synthase [Friedmanniella luteola]|uniref:8-amino-7-oxononanoate synthase n=1 Tax=Friedmanniella luteola TaxID=546871 RepID=A0A1H1WDC1_9ACTN|nr:aminotransferase class I/II-fold pyridoxal phosphate-dependent enzyme [Friedmanniella luteola]SDS94660.1 8-amino-7-oxononanoate synthase [Friedmanniella luteola]